MSYELASESEPGVWSSITGTIASWFRPERPQYAHPWTAYSPANFQPQDPVKVDVSAASIGQADAVSPISKEVADDTSASVDLAQAVTQDELPETAKASLDEASSETVASETASLEAEAVAETKPVAKVSTLRLVSSNDLSKAHDATKAQTDKPVLPGVAASTGRNFQLAARLASVSAQNRKLAPVTSIKAIKGSGLNRPIHQPAIAKRSLSIQPPAVGRRTRRPAEVVQLSSLTKRAERPQVKTAKTA